MSSTTRTLSGAKKRSEPWRKAGFLPECGIGTDHFTWFVALYIGKKKRDIKKILGSRELFNKGREWEGVGFVL